jgi:prolyl oligopeptidase
MPTVQPHPVERTVGGVAFVDRWAHLEQDSDDVLAWQQKESATARQQLRGGCWQELRDRLAQVVPEPRVYAPDRRGGRWFRLVLPEGQQQPVLRVSDDPAAAGRVLVDPNAVSAATGQPVTLDFAFPSPGGRLVAYGLSTAGTEASVVHVVDVDSGQVLADRVQLTMASTIAWTPDAAGFYYAAADPSAPALQLVLHHHTVGGASVRVPGQPQYRHPVVMPQLSRDGRWLAAVVDHLAPRPDHLVDTTTGEWQPFLIAAEGAMQGDFLGDAWVAVSTHKSPRGRVVSVPLDAGSDASRWRELVPETDAVLRNVAVAGDLIVLSTLVDCASRIAVHRSDGTFQAELALPDAGTASIWGVGYQLPFAPMLGSTDDEQAGLVFASLATSPAVLVADLRGGRVRTAVEPAVTLDGLTVLRFRAPSSGGVEVPYTVVTRAGVDEPTPALLYAYGGFNVAFTPGFLAEFTPFVEAGGALVLCHLRGGGELGVDWWEGGRQARKQHTFDDLYAVAQDVVRRGSARRLACFGGSNGGVLTAVAGVQRPDLWDAVVSDRPVLDLLSVGRDPYTLAAVAADYGDPMSPADAAVLAAWSPYQNVRDDVTYPPTLVVAGANDPRCPAWHARKHVARLREAGGGPVLLRVWEDSGHLGMDTGEQLDKHAEWLGFVLEHLGL